MAEGIDLHATVWAGNQGQHTKDISGPLVRLQIRCRSGQAARGIAIACLLLVAACAFIGQRDEVRLPPAQEGDYRAIYGNVSQGIMVFRYKPQPRILVFDFPSLYQQGDMFNRAVALVERNGAPRDRILNDQELAQYIDSVGQTRATFAFGNDLLVSELVTFFNRASQRGIALNEQEKALKQFLLDNGLIRARDGGLENPGLSHVILSIPRTGSYHDNAPPVTPLVRKTILRHELSHGEYFTNPAYAKYCHDFWSKTMTEQQRGAFRKFLAHMNYDASNEDIMINETQAYLMHTPDPAAFSAKSVGMSDQEIAELRKRFMAGNPPTHLFDILE